MTAILKRDVKSGRKSDSVGRCVFTWSTFCQISPRSDYKRRSARLYFEEVTPTRRQDE